MNIDKKNKKIHFIGINGSGCSGVALAAHKMGFDVTGCDKNSDTPYAKQIRDAGIRVFDGHDVSHVTDADIVAVSPALTTCGINIAEVEHAKSTGKLMTWQQLIGKCILPEYDVVAVCGTHGKTTTTSMIARILELAGFDPTAFIGAIIPEWNSSCRLGASKWLVLEADEYANNFASYHPKYIILNNLEMEHPEFFRDFDHYRRVFADFLAGAVPGGALVYNREDKNVVDILDAYSGPKIPFSASDADGFEIGLLGRHNKSNAAAAIVLARELGIADDVIRKALRDFRGAAHRLERIFENDKFILFDDYAHHHSQVINTLDALKSEYKNVIAVYEPHQISRYTQNRAETLRALAGVSESVIVEFWRGREGNLAVPDVASDIMEFGLDNVRYIPDDAAAVDYVLGRLRETTDRTAVVVMGAGQSYKISDALKSEFEKL